MKHLFIFVLLMSKLIAGTYDDLYTIEKLDINKSEQLDPFMYGQFIQIKRYDSIDFSDKYPDDSSRENLNNIIKDIKANELDNKIKIKIIGHTSIDFDEDNESLENSKNHAREVYRILVDNNISKEILYPEYRGFKDLAYLPTTSDNIDISNRVMVTMYVLSPKDKDSDGDGVFNSADECPNTPPGVEVDKIGCALDTDGDGVVNYKDKCPGTLKGLKVDQHGCPYDSDKDGVFNYKDKCSATIEGLRVDLFGCPINRELKLNFKTDSFVIPEASYAQVNEFAEFLKENPAYRARIVGHTDSIGKSGYNMILSLNRAKAVKEALVKEGIKAGKIEVFGRGELDPILTNRSIKGRAANRRIEVTLFY